MSVTLSRRALPSLPPEVAAPQYAPGDLTPGIVHFGVGNFHRAHQAVYLDDLFNRGLGRDFAIVGAGVRATDGAMRDALEAQDWLTTVVEQEADFSAARVTGAMIDFVPVGDTEALLTWLADPRIRIVSLTVTEGGYYIDPATQLFDPAHPDIVADAKNPRRPRTVFGLILAGLRRRRDAGIPPFTVMSCDNIPGNGHVTQNAVVGLCELGDHEMAGWIRTRVAFPNGMVDRITPATTDRERTLVAEGFGVGDAWPVFCEQFRQWVLEDNFPAGRPPLEAAGVQFVADVAPYEHMKIRILNGGHATIAYPAGLMDIHFVHEAMEDNVIRRFLARVTSDEIIPAVPPVPATDLEDYRRLIERRFANPKIGDTIRRLCLDGSNRQPKFVLPTVADRLASGFPVPGLALVSALWARYCFGTTESGRSIEPNDPSWDRLTAQAAQARETPEAWLEMADIFGDIGRHPDYRRAFSTALSALWADGTRATLMRYLDGTL